MIDSLNYRFKLEEYKKMRDELFKLKNEIKDYREQELNIPRSVSIFCNNFKNKSKFIDRTKPQQIKKPLKLKLNFD